MKNRILILIILITGLVQACIVLNEDAPSDLIPPDKMARILVDIHEVEMQVSRMGLGSYDSSNVAYSYLEASLFDRFEIDSGQYRKSYEYYAANPTQFMRIYDDVELLLDEKSEEKAK